MAVHASVSSDTCEKTLNNMNAVSNQKICHSNRERDLGYYFKITFSIDHPVTFNMRVPTDFGNGGVSAIDGVAQRVTTKNIYNSNLLDFSIRLERGEHVLEVIGGEDCCDGALKWTFTLTDQPLYE